MVESSLKPNFIAKIWQEWQAAMMFLTILPALPAPKEKIGLHQCFWAFPIIGALLGFIMAGFIYVALYYLYLPSLVALSIAFAIYYILTGALHEDGLADICDGAAARGDIKKRRAIMRDSQLGSFGVIGLILAIITKIALYDYLLFKYSYYFLMLMVMATMLARAIVPFALTFFPSQDTKSGAYMPAIGKTQLGFVVMIMLIPMIYYLPFILLMAVLAANIFLLLAFGYWARWRLQGMSGDACGALIVLSEIVTLIGLTAAFNISIFNINLGGILG